MEMAGCKIDNAQLSQLSFRILQKISIMENKIYQNCGEEFNVGSPKQLGEILFEKLNLPFGKREKWELSNGC